MFYCQNPDREPRTYLVDMGGKLYQKTRECLQPNCISQEPGATSAQKASQVRRHHAPLVTSFMIGRKDNLEETTETKDKTLKQ